jgi:hypothetical protein
VGFELKAVVCPVILHNKEDFTEEISKIAALYAATQRDEVINAAYEIYGATTEPPEETEDGDVDGQMDLTETE